MLSVGGILLFFATKEKRTFFKERKKVPMVTKPGGWGDSGRSKGLRKELFFAASLTACVKIYDIEIEGKYEKPMSKRIVCKL